MRINLIIVRQERKTHMASRACGPVVYELITGGGGSPLTDAQADGLIHECANLGMRYKRQIWNGETCIIVQAPAAQYERFREKWSQSWREIHSRVGIQTTTSRANTYEPGRSTFVPGKDWAGVEAFINANYRQEDQHEKQRRQQEKQRRRQRRMEIQATRKAAHQCVLCGLPLGFLAKLLGKDHHNRCTTFKLSESQAQADDARKDDEIPGLVNDDEISALINLAQDASAGYDARAKAIQSLGEVGGSRAIDPLMQIYNTELHLIRLDAKDAVDKIRMRGE